MALVNWIKNHQLLNFQTKISKVNKVYSKMIFYSKYWICATFSVICCLEKFDFEKLQKGYHLVDSNITYYKLETIES